MLVSRADNSVLENNFLAFLPREWTEQLTNMLRALPVAIQFSLDRSFPRNSAGVKRVNKIPYHKIHRMHPISRSKSKFYVFIEHRVPLSRRRRLRSLSSPLHCCCFREERSRHRVYRKDNTAEKKKFSTGNRLSGGLSCCSTVIASGSDRKQYSRLN
jgi:hypothetical protein